VIDEFCDWLSATSISVVFQNATWFVPLIQTIHIIAISIFLISVYLIGFKLVGLTRWKKPLAILTASSAPWIWGALGVLLATGALLIITEPARELLNWAFRIKMVLVLLLSGLLLVVQLSLRANPLYWAASPGRQIAARTVGIAALVIGASIVTAGRWIAYVQ
jgi:hypothetical protein